MAPAGNPYVLIVGGDEISRAALARRLGADSYIIIEEAQEANVLRTARKQRPDIVLLDTRAGKPDFHASLDAMKGDKELLTVPVIVLGPRNGAESIERYLAKGADDFLLDPISPALLRAQVNEYVAIGSRRQEVLERAQREMLLKIERDVQIARQIQLSFLPEELPQPKGWEFAARFYPAREVAGDFYDAFYMTQGRRVGFVLGDVCDKGVGAALFMALTRSLIRAFAQQHYSLGWTDVLSDSPSPNALRDLRRGGPAIGTTPLKNAVMQTNSYITTNHLELNMFATMFFGMVDPTSGALAYINGGHNPPYILGPDGALKASLKPTGPAVGMMPDSEFALGEAKLDEGDTLLVYTDGYIDARDVGGRRYTQERFDTILRRPIPSAVGLLDRLDASVHEHIGAASQFDDITLLAVRRAPAAA